MSINDIKFLEIIKQGFKRTFSCNKYRSKITTQTKNSNLGYLVNPTFRVINRLFVFSFKNGNNDPTRNFFNTYYMSLVEINNSNALINNKPFFDQPVKNKQEVYEKLIKMSRNDDYTTGNLMDYLHHQNYCKLIGIDNQDKEIQIFLHKLILQENLKKIMVQQCFSVLKSSKITFKIFL